MRQLFGFANVDCRGAARGLDSAAKQLMARWAGFLEFAEAVRIKSDNQNNQFNSWTVF